MNRFWMIYSTISQKVIIKFENPIVHKLQINSQTKMVLKKYFGVGFFDGVKIVDGILISADSWFVGIGIAIPWIKKHKEQFNLINGPLKKHFSIDSSAFAYMGLFEGHN